MGVITISSVDVLFGQDMVLDDEAFENAAEGFESISSKIKQLRADVEDLMETLKKGFDTPAGVKFVNSCEKNLYRPLDDQKLVIDHIKETLLASKQQYQSVFEEYSELQSTINNMRD